MMTSNLYRALATKSRELALLAAPSLVEELLRLADDAERKAAALEGAVESGVPIRESE
jgi:hypothetical protein